jgi:cytochrome c553
MRDVIVAGMLMCAAMLPASAQSVEARLAACLACHGESGRSDNPEVPSLGGQPEFYLTIQLYMFRERLRVVDVMNEMMKGMNDDDLRKMASTIAKLPPPKPDGDGQNSTTAADALALIEQNRCNFCHSRNFAGEQNVPRLAGQREDYLVKAMREYKSNARRGYDASMADVLYSVSDDQIRTLAHYLAGLP